MLKHPAYQKIIGMGEPVVFSGHSLGGTLYLREREKLAIADLNTAFSTALKRGLKLAIFNSCDGLGLAHSLLQLNLPQVVAMRERIPDKVAQDFLTFFLMAYSRGNSLFLSVREARERLQHLDYCFLRASWLPAIFQNPAAELYR